MPPKAKQQQQPAQPQVPTRQRQDLALPGPLRAANDMRAKDNEQLLQLGFVRDGKDPNESDADDAGAMADGYEPPVVDAARTAVAWREHLAEYEAVRRKRLAQLRALRKTAAHAARSPFDKMCAESTLWMLAVGDAEAPAAAAAAAAADAAPAPSPSPSSSPRKKMQQHQQEEEAAMSQRDVTQSGGPPADGRILTDSPKFLCGTLRDYQLQGVNWLLAQNRNFRNGILADEMGLGKTFQTIATLAVHKFIHHIPGPHLIIAPKSVLGNWFREVRKWCPALSVFRFHAAKEFRKILLDANVRPPLKYDVVVTTYEMVVFEQRAFQKVQWNYVIVDEAHKLKNSEGQVHGVLASLPAVHRLLVTGTPLQNDLTELWSLLNFLAPELYDSSKCFKQWFHAAEGRQDEGVIQNLHQVLEPIMLRRLKNDVNTGIPPKKEIYVACPMTRLQRQWYLRVLARDSESINKSGSNRDALMNIVMQLRKAVNHPYLFPEADETRGYTTNEKIVRDCGKMMILDKLLRRLAGDKEARNKVLLFSQFTSMLDIIEDYVIFRGWKYCRLDGNTSAFDRDMQMADFNNAESDKFIFLLSTRAGGVGINLQAANNVVLYDSDWNPQMDLQAQDRAHRIGQKREVRVYRLVTDNTIEQRIYERALAKLYLDACVVQQGRIASKMQKQLAGDGSATREELMSMVRFGANEMFKSRDSGGEVTEADIDALIDAGASKNDELQNKIRSEQQASLASFRLGATQNSLYDFEGVDYKRDAKAGQQSKMLHVAIDAAAPVPESELRDEFASYGEVVKVALHPNLREALVTFKNLASAVAAKARSPRPCQYAVKNDSAEIVTAEMTRECWDMGAARAAVRGRRLFYMAQFF